MSILRGEPEHGKQITGGTEQTDSTKYCYGDDPGTARTTTEDSTGGRWRWGFERACDTVALGSGPLARTR